MKTQCVILSKKPRGGQCQALSFWARESGEVRGFLPLAQPPEAAACLQASHTLSKSLICKGDGTF